MDVGERGEGVGSGLWKERNHRVGLRVRDRERVNESYLRFHGGRRPMVVEVV